MPSFPIVNLELGMRKLIDIDTQKKIISKIHDMSYDRNPKIWLGIKWLATYISIRPGEIISLREMDIDKYSGYFIIPSPKEKRPKIIPMIDEDLALLNELKSGSDEQPFFRHEAGISGVCKYA